MDVPDLVPARILNDTSTAHGCAWLEWSEREFRHYADTAEGEYVHRRVDAERGRPPSSADVDPDADELPPTTSVSLNAPVAGISAKLDMLRLADGRAIPVEYKRGRPPDDGEVWAPERIQLAAYATVLREHGFRFEHGEVWFAETGTWHIVELTEDDARAVADAVTEARSNALRDQAPPPPLVDSPKCPRCSLVSLCLPDETNPLAGKGSRPGG